MLQTYQIWRVANLKIYLSARDMQTFLFIYTSIHMYRDFKSYLLYTLNIKAHNLQLYSYHFMHCNMYRCGVLSCKQLFNISYLFFTHFTCALLCRLGLVALDDKLERVGISRCRPYLTRAEERDIRTAAGTQRHHAPATL